MQASPSTTVIHTSPAVTASGLGYPNTPLSDGTCYSAWTGGGSPLRNGEGWGRSESYGVVGMRTPCVVSLRRAHTSPPLLLFLLVLFRAWKRTCLVHARFLSWCRTACERWWGGRQVLLHAMARWRLLRHRRCTVRQMLEQRCTDMQYLTLLLWHHTTCKSKHQLKH